MARRQVALEPRQAATRIQAQYRSHQARRRLRRQQDAARRIQARVRGWLARVRRAELDRQRGRQERFQRVMARHQERVQAREQELHYLRTMPAAELERYEERRTAAARAIQAAWKGHRQRGEFRRRAPELQRRQMAATAIQSAFRSSSPLRASRRQAAEEAAEAGAEAGAPRRSAAEMRDSGGGYSSPARDDSGGLLMTEARRAQLLAQIEQRVRRHRVAKQVPQQDEEAIRLHKRYEALLRERNQGRRAAERGAAARLHARRQAEISFANLRHKHTALAGIAPSAEPHHFSLPPADSQRMARARAGHAASLAQERAGMHWWKHLAALNGTAEAVDDSWTIWDEVDNSRVARWARVLHEEELRRD
eukprot:jgi/Tetstr1/430720/TSEL_020511.t1